MNRPKLTRVLVTIDSLLAGGAERVAINGAAGLDRTRFLPHVLVSRGTGPLEQELRDARVPFTILHREGRFDRKAVERAGDVIRQADIVHSHKFANNLFTLLAARGSGVPVVVHEHNWSDQSGRARTMLDRFIIGRRAARYICCAESVASVVRHNGVPDSKIVVIDNGVDLTPGIDRRSARGMLDLPSDDLVIGIIAHLRPEKAHDFLLRAFATVPDTINGRTVRLCIVGDGNERSQLESLARELGIDRRVSFAGSVERASNLVSACDLGTLVSDWEGMPLSVLEFMAKGIPVVATAVGALPELISGGNAQRPAGWLVPPRDEDALAAALTAALRDSDLSAIRGGHGRRRVAGRFSIESTVSQFQQLYDEVLSEHGSVGNEAGTTNEEAA